MEERDEIGEGERGEDGEVGLHGRKQELENRGLRSLRVEVGAVDVLRDFFAGKGEDGVDVVELIGVDVAVVFVS